ncbi:uncharacterized protein BDZ99DRAFT_74283 [Mytilinidion resinicola]|uniref:Uncharacterized protein n=1 Tax=Mytilinidion resinicola TaxID=574789 RepID=A0A6A6YGG5_9PEZI|nr:uncharacterized protein BDZ99DRAFT_74283 [Mytilinidion resinicola]KAF2807104.1 hypothetical protein BDZ99DRAFT_74283 [Mytilinidion resinicola]
MEVLWQHVDGGRDAGCHPPHASDRGKGRTLLCSSIYPSQREEIALFLQPHLASANLEKLKSAIEELNNQAAGTLHISGLGVTYMNSVSTIYPLHHLTSDRLLMPVLPFDIKLRWRSPITALQWPGNRCRLKTVCRNIACVNRYKPTSQWSKIRLAGVPMGENRERAEQGGGYRQMGEDLGCTHRATVMTVSFACSP